MFRHSQIGLDVFRDDPSFGRKIVSLISHKVRNGYLDHSKDTGHLQDIDCAISHHQRAVEFTPSGHANLPSYLNHLGKAYFDRFKQSGDLQDVNHAISHVQRAVESTSADHANLPGYLSNLHQEKHS